MGRLDEVVDLAEEVGAVARAHELQGGFRFGFAVVEGLAADAVVEFALAGAERGFALAGNAFFDFAHEIGDRLVWCIGREGREG